jgi:hypothetical protein
MNANHCCSMCRETGGETHGLYCTQHAPSNVETTELRAIDALTPTLSWEVDSRKSEEETAAAPAAGAGPAATASGEAAPATAVEATPAAGSGGRWGRFGHVVTRTDGRCDMCGAHIDHVGDDPLGEYREDPQPFDTTGEYLEQPHVAGGLQTPPRADVPPRARNGRFGLASTCRWHGQRRPPERHAPADRG